METAESLWLRKSSGLSGTFLPRLHLRRRRPFMSYRHLRRRDLCRLRLLRRDVTCLLRLRRDICLPRRDLCRLRLRLHRDTCRLRPRRRDICHRRLRRDTCLPRRDICRLHRRDVTCLRRPRRAGDRNQENPPNGFYINWAKQRTNNKGDPPCSSNSSSKTSKQSSPRSIAASRAAPADRNSGCGFLP